MPFNVKVCADLLGRKVNLILDFAGVPSYEELMHRTNQVFTNELRVITPSYGYQGPAETSFVTSRMQVYDRYRQQWLDLVDTATQLAENNTQVYARREVAGSPHAVRDVQQEMPAARYPTSVGHAASPPPLSAAASPSIGSPYRAGYASSPYAAAAPPVGDWRIGTTRPNIPFQDKVDRVFEDFNQSRSGAMRRDEMERGFTVVDIDFAQVTLDELFTKADQNRDGVVTPDEWRQWCSVYPNTLECVYFRGRDKAEEEASMAALQQLNDEAVNIDAREQQLQHELQQLRARRDEVRQQQQQHEQRKAAYQQRRDTLEQRERDLMEQEIRLERQRLQLKLQEQRFNVAAKNFDTATELERSPRRAMRGASMN